MKLLFILLLLLVGCEDTPTLSASPEESHGCLDSQACNYDSSATIDNNSCLYYDYCNECGGDNTTCEPEVPSPYEICENIYNNMNKPIVRIGAKEFPIPSSKYLEDLVLPQIHEIEAGIRNLVL